MHECSVNEGVSITSGDCQGYKICYVITWPSMTSQSGSHEERLD